MRDGGDFLSGVAIMKMEPMTILKKLLLSSLKEIKSVVHVIPAIIDFGNLEMLSRII